MPSRGASGDWNFGFANIHSRALAQRQIVPRTGSPFPIRASARTDVDCDNPGYRATYQVNPIPFNANPFSNANASSPTRSCRLRSRSSAQR